MSIYRMKMIALVVGATTVVGTSASAQLPVVDGRGGSGDAARATRAANINRIQAQVQQRAQAQARLQVDAARAANIAQHAAAVAQRQAASAQQRAASGARLKVGANTSIDGKTSVANQSANAKLYAGWNIDGNLALPPGITKADVEIYDRIFGRFNPLCQLPRDVQPVSRVTFEQEAANSTNAKQDKKQAASDERQPAGEPILAAWNRYDLATRINVAGRERRAEISQLRDRALATSDIQLMAQAEQAEGALDAFLKAQAEAQARAAAAQTNSAARGAASAQAQTEASAQGAAEATLNPPGLLPTASTETSGRADGITEATTTP